MDQLLDFKPIPGIIQCEQNSGMNLRYAVILLACSSFSLFYPCVIYRLS